MLQKEAAVMIGVDETSIYSWENSRSTPELRYMPKLIEFLGYDPLNTATATFGERIVLLRRARGITQERLARMLGVDPSTLARWERGEGRPPKKNLRRLQALIYSGT